MKKTNIIKDLRNELGMTQTELAKAIGISQCYLSCIEIGIRPANLRVAWAIKIFAKDLGIDLPLEDIAYYSYSKDVDV